MTNKVEFFKAVDSIDGLKTIFAIQSIDGEDVAYNSIRMSKEAKFKNLARMIMGMGGCSWPDSSSKPRRDDMINPKLIYTLTISE